MSLSTSVVLKRGATGATLTGGTDTTFINDGRGTNGNKVLVDSSNGNLLTRQTIQTSIVQAVAAPNVNALAKLGRSKVIVKAPFVDSNGKTYQLPDTFEMTYHPSMTEAQRITKFWDTIAVIIDSELTNLFTKAVND